jgi:chromosome segregation ATPase
MRILHDWHHWSSRVGEFSSHAVYSTRLQLGITADYNKAQTLTTKATTLSKKIVDARLALTRLRQTHPHPRITIPIATATLEEQIVAMQTHEGELQELNKQLSGAKEKLRGAKGEMERLRTQRAEVEKEAAVGTGGLGDDESRLIPLYDW